MNRPAVLLLSCAVLLAGEPQPPPEMPPQYGPNRKEKADLDLVKMMAAGTIAFQSNRDGKWAIYVVNVDGTTPRSVSRPVDPDKKMPAEPVGFGPRRLTDPSFDSTLPQWTLDEKKLAFLSNRDGPGKVYWMDDDGSNVEELPGDDPDADVTAFHITRSGRVMTVRHGPRDWVLRRRRLDQGWQTHRIDLSAFPGAGGELDIVPSPNGRRVALCFSGGTGAPGGIYVMDMDSEGKLTAPRRLGPGLSVAWTGSNVKVLSCIYAPGGCDVFEWSVRRAIRVQVTSQRGWEWMPTASPDWRWVLYAFAPSQHSDPARGPYDLYLRRLPDGDPVRLTFHSAPDLHPSWRGTVAGTIPMKIPGRSTRKP